MTPSAIRVAEGQALDAFVLERVCGWSGRDTFYAWADRKARAAPVVMFTSNGSNAVGSYNAFVHAATGVKYYCGTPSGLFSVEPLSTDAAACWRWVVPAVEAKHYRWRLDYDGSDYVFSIWPAKGPQYVFAYAPTPALAITRAAALTVAEEERR